MKKLKKLFSFALILALMLVLAPSAPAESGLAYRHDKTAVANNPVWMAALPDDVRITEVSVPGTHDSMAYQGVTLLSDIVLTQSMTLEQQLASGIRFLDIRLDHEGSKFVIRHTIFNLNASFDDVLNTVRRFLKQHPSETVLMRVRQENERVSERKMAELLTAYCEREENRGLFYDGGSYCPTVGELRGKIFLLREDIPAEFGTDYDYAHIQDYFELRSNWDLYNKWEKIKAYIGKADASGSYSMYINFLSGSVGSMPYFVASGKSSHGTNAPQLSTGLLVGASSTKYPDFPRKNLLFGVKEIDFLGTNQLMTNYLNTTRPGYVGIIPADFPGEALINAVIACNFR